MLGMSFGYYVKLRIFTPSHFISFPFMKDLNPYRNSSNPPYTSVGSLKEFFDHSIKELYFSENAIGEAFNEIQHRIRSRELKKNLLLHYRIHLNHKKRLEKIFSVHQISSSPKDTWPVNAVLNQALQHLNLFAHDTYSWEIALLLTARKLAHYKIAYYGSAAHLALSFNHTQAATLLAISVQEEEEFMERYLNGLTHELLSPPTGGRQKP